ncbi:hypothetical protein [Streptomyces sp.]|uniref:RICIN domain-containing protein n=1 Tax=Streptomyces sp. TaxID=1931 RepID=UPI002D779780|nr:hypothetical protein [Streptomyces sp.]HET6355952.1 hypothetical protein [Streptomyces sp.]
MGTPNGNVVQENANGTMEIAAPNNGGAQLWREYTDGEALTHSLQSSVSKLCIAAPTGTRRDTSSQAVTADCSDPRSQWTTSHLEDDPGWNGDSGGPVRWQNVAFPGMCLPPSNKQVTLETVHGGRRPAVEDQPRGSRLCRSGSVPGTSVSTQPTPPWWWWIYWQRNEQVDFGWNIQRIDSADNLVRLQSMDGDNRCLGVRDEHANSETDAVLRTCDDPRGVDGAGQRWLSETYADGTVRYRNEANHLCLTAPSAGRRCGADRPSARWGSRVQGFTTLQRSARMSLHE